jgi:hypothetical protein
MMLERRSDASSHSAARMAEERMIDAWAAEAIESVEYSEPSFHPGAARGILNAVVIGAGAWILILGAVVLTRSVLFG